MQVTEVAREDPLQLSRNTVQEQTAVVAFTALYYSGLPFQVLALPMQSSLHSPLHPEAAILQELKKLQIALSSPLRAFKRRNRLRYC